MSAELEILALSLNYFNVSVSVSLVVCTYLNLYKTGFIIITLWLIIATPLLIYFMVNVRDYL